MLSLMIFSHDYYMLDLSSSELFYKNLPYYKDLLNYNNCLLNKAPVIRLYCTNWFG